MVSDTILHAETYWYVTNYNMRNEGSVLDAIDIILAPPNDDPTFQVALCRQVLNYHYELTRGDKL